MSSDQPIYEDDYSIDACEELRGYASVLPGSPPGTFAQPVRTVGLTLGNGRTSFTVEIQDRNDVERISRYWRGYLDALPAHPVAPTLRIIISLAEG